jgi:integrase
MAKVKFTAGRVAGFKCDEGQAQAFLWCDAVPGFAVRATANGAKSYIFQAKVNGKTMRSTIGTVSAWGIDAAQAEARRLQILIDQGDDPRQVKAEKAAATEAKRAREKRKEVTVGEAWVAYVAAREHKWGDSHRNDHDTAVKVGGKPRGRGRRAGQGDVTYPGLIHPLLRLRLADLTAERVQDWLSVANQRGKTDAAKCFRLLRAFINWCAERKEYDGITSADAHAKREVRDLVQKVRAKKLALQREQLPLWFESVRKIGNPTIAAYLQTLLITGARRQELAQLRWADCDFEWMSLHIKDKVSEDGRDIPLTPYVRALLLALPRHNEFVFASPKAKTKYLADPLTPLQKAMRSAGLPAFSPHDLRRSFATLSEWSEVPAGVVAQIMGHSASAIAEKHYIDRPLDLLRMWHTRIETWILEQAGIEQPSDKAKQRLKVVTAA